MTENKNSLGMDQKTASWFAYVLSWLSAVILLATEKDNKVVRQHAWQSLFLGCAMTAIYIVFGIIISIAMPSSPEAILNMMVYGVSPIISIIGVIEWLLGLGWLALTIICILKATQNDMFKIPVVYGWVEKMK